MTLSMIASLNLLKIGNRKVIHILFILYSVLAFSFGSLSLIDLIYQSDEIRNLLYNLQISSIYFHYIVFSIFFYYVFYDSPFKYHFLISSLTIFIIILFVGNVDISNGRNHLSFLVANLFLIGCSIVYFLNLFNRPPEFNLLQTPSFWVSSGILISMSVTLLVFLFEKFDNGYMQKYMLRYVIGVASIFYGVLHLFLIIAYRCSVRWGKWI